MSSNNFSVSNDLVKKSELNSPNVSLGLGDIQKNKQFL